MPAHGNGGGGAWVLVDQPEPSAIRPTWREVHRAPDGTHWLIPEGGDHPIRVGKDGAGNWISEERLQGWRPNGTTECWGTAPSSESDPAEAGEFGRWLAEDLDLAADERYRRIFEQEPAPPEQLIPNLLALAPWGLVGPGGISKTTLVLWLAIRVILGRPVGARPVLFEGARVLFVSAEDDVGIIDYRVRQLADAEGLDDLQRAIVAKALMVEDWSGKLRRLVEQGLDGNLALTEWVHGLGKKYAGQGVRLVVFDPAVFFGPGERFVNDGEASLMQAARFLGNRLGGAAVGFIHHTGQSAARDKVTDQYAGRGGSAFADNARSLLVLHRHEAEIPDYPRPLGIASEAVQAGRVFRLHVAKYSAGPPQRQPLWVVRGADDPWQFEVFEPPEDVSALREARAATMQSGADACVWQYVAEHQDTTPQTRQSLKEVRPGGLSRRDAEAAVQRLLDAGCLRFAPLPKELRQGGRTQGLRAVEAPPGVVGCGRVPDTESAQSG